MGAEIQRVFAAYSPTGTMGQRLNGRRCNSPHHASCFGTSETARSSRIPVGRSGLYPAGAWAWPRARRVSRCSETFRFRVRLTRDAG